MNGFPKYEVNSSLDFSGRTKIVGIGSALVDMISHQSHQLVESLGHAKGGMTLAEVAFIEATVAKLLENPAQSPGGSACNTIVGVGQLGGEARFIGKCGRDELGERLESSLQEANVEPMLLRSHTPTGQVLSLVTPDAQRTMFTFLGASSEIVPEEIIVEPLAEAAIVHLEGYLLFNWDLTVRCFEAACEAGARISLDLASYTVVEAAGEKLHELVREYVDILLANEDEARAYTGLTDESAMLSALAEEAPIAALKTGPRGALIQAGDAVIKITAVTGGDIVDTTGAGDLWASGLLYGLVQGWSLEQAGTLAALCGFEVCQVDGAQIPDEGYERIRAWMERY